MEEIEDTTSGKGEVAFITLVLVGSEEVESAVSVVITVEFTREVDVEVVGYLEAQRSASVSKFPRVVKIC